MKEHIQGHLKRMAAEHGFRLLYACETGSRGWGFASPDSDFDIRFVVAYPQDKYLNLLEPTEQFNTIFEDKGEVLDFNGWELRKFLRLLSKSNASPYEWLQSPIIYHNENGFREQIWEHAPQCHSPRSAVHHYLGICHNSLHSGITGEFINIKKYFYVLRPLLAAKWAAERQSIPPMQFAPLLSQLDPNSELMAAINELLEKKEQANEGASTPLVPVIQAFIHSEMEYCNTLAQTLGKKTSDLQPLNDFFKQWI